MATRVLLVEDDSDDTELFYIFFSGRKDISILRALNNGLELIEYLMGLESDDELPDLIVIDQNMPLMNGIQTLQFLKSHDRFARIPAVIYSTYADDSLIVDGQKLGAGAVATKPVDDEGYQKMMDDFLGVLG